MRGRWLVALLLVAIGVLAAVLYTGSDLTIRRTVPATPPMIGADPSAASTEQVAFIECSDGAARYVSEDGTPIGFNVSTWTLAPADGYCEDARSDRATTSLAFVVIGAGAALAVVADGVARRRRREDLAREPLASAQEESRPAHLDT